MFESALAETFMEEEGSRAPLLTGHLRIAGTGTLAARLLGSAGFRGAMAGVDFEVVPPHADVQELLGDSGWDMAVVLSPHKAAVAAAVPELTPTAAATGTVDTLVRAGAEIVAFNTTAWAVQITLQTLCEGLSPQTVLVLGAGASARSVMVAVKRALPQADVVLSTRAPASVTAFPNATVVSASDAEALSPGLVINATTWGETAESERERFELPFAGLLRPGLRFLDLNTRLSGLQQQALSAGAAVASGAAVRIANNACRRALVTRREGP